MRPSFFQHLHPPTIPAAQARWRHTLGAGGMAIFLLLVLGLTGILEMFYYSPDPELAALSVQTITYLVPFGGFVRNLHYWSAQFLVIVSGIHLLRVIFTAAYHRPRRFNYLLGLALFVILILLDFTGYILRWDQDICWALVTGTNLLKGIPWIGGSLFKLAVGGEEACSSALLRFFVWHVYGLALLAGFFTIWHAFRVRRDGGIAVPPPAFRIENARIPRSQLVQREVLAMYITGVILILLSSIFPAPIGPPMTGSLDPASAAARGPWFFLWVQQMLKWGDPLTFGVLIPLAMLVLLALIPFVLPKPAESEIGGWFPRSNRLAQVLVGVLVIVVVVLTLLAVIPL